MDILYEMKQQRLFEVDLPLDVDRIQDVCSGSFRTTLDSLVEGVRSGYLFRLFNIPDDVLGKCPYGVAYHGCVMPLEVRPDSMVWAVRDDLSVPDQRLKEDDLAFMTGLRTEPEYLPAWVIMLSVLKHRTAYRRPGRHTVYGFRTD